MSNEYFVYGGIFLPAPVCTGNLLCYNSRKREEKENESIIFRISQMYDL